MSAVLSSGIDRLLADRDRILSLRRQRVGLLSNEACRTAAGTTTAEALNAALGDETMGLSCLFAPEHGFATNAAAGARISDDTDPATGLPIISLYGARAAPTPGQLSGLDTLIIDLRDIGVRCYTYAATAAMASNAALDAGLAVVICDRANPLGPGSAGPALDAHYKSLLAHFDVPFVHGQTLGELVASATADHANAAALTIIPSDNHSDLDQPSWVAPSPALQHPDAVRLYPGLVMLEGTNMSEGRGTPWTFRAVGAPWLDAPDLADIANNWPGDISAEACEILPDSGEFENQSLPAVRFSLERPLVDSFEFGVRLIAWIAQHHEEFQWRPNSTADGYFIDALMGSDSLRTALDAGSEADDILKNWAA